MVAVHGEDAVGDDDLAARVLRFHQFRFEVCHVLVGVPVALRFAEADAVNDGGVVQGVGDDGILRPEQGLKDPAVGVEAAGEKDGVLGTEEPRDPGLELQVQVLGAADEADAGHAEAALIHGRLGGAYDVRMVRQAKVVVGAEVQHVRALPADDARGDVA